MAYCQKCGGTLLFGNQGYGGRICMCQIVKQDVYIPPFVPNEIEILRQQLSEEQSYKADAERYRWIIRQADITDFIFCFVKSDERHVNNAIDQAMKDNLTKGVTNE